MCSTLFSRCLTRTKAGSVETDKLRALNSKRLAHFKSNVLKQETVCVSACVSVCAPAFACMCLRESPSRPVSISLCVFTVATPKPSRSPVRHHNGPRKSIWRFETPKKRSPRFRPATLPPSTIMRFSRFILPQRHDRLRNHKDPISQEGFTISLGDRRANRIGQRAARANWVAAQVGGTWLWGGGDTVTWMENGPLFLVICVTEVLIDDRRDGFPTLP